MPSYGLLQRGVPMNIRCRRPLRAATLYYTISFFLNLVQVLVPNFHSHDLSLRAVHLNSCIAGRSQCCPCLMSPVLAGERDSLGSISWVEQESASRMLHGASFRGISRVSRSGCTIKQSAAQRYLYFRIPSP